MVKTIKIHEVGLRDGLQNEEVIVGFDRKLKWAELLSNTGIDYLQVGSFVNPKKVPQMSDSDNLFKELKKIKHKAILSGLVLNERGMDRALDCGVELICLGVSASDTHSLKNSGMATEEALNRIISMGKELINKGNSVQVSIQSAFGCGFEGEISEEKVIKIATRYIDEGLFNISLADTAGHAYPEQVKRLYDSIKKMSADTILTAHFHNTYGLGLTNCYAAIESGAEIIETAFGGLGGCPFTKVAAGNVSTEDFVSALQRNQKRNDIMVDPIIDIAKESASILGRSTESYVSKAGRIKY